MTLRTKASAAAWGAPLQRVSGAGGRGSQRATAGRVMLVGSPGRACMVQPPNRAVTSPLLHSAPPACRLQLRDRR